MAAPRCAGVLLATLAASVTLALGAVPAAADDSAPYGDTSPDAFYYEAVEALARDGVFAGTGCQEGFCPGEPLDRATMAVWTVRVLDGEDPDPVGSTRFADVDASHPYAAFIERFAELGVTSGCGDGTIYCPDGTVTRAQMAVFLSRAFSLDDGPDPGFSDVAPDAWYAPDVAKLAASGITEGCGDGTRFCPGRPTTRAQMAVFLHRALELPDQPTDATYEGDALEGPSTGGNFRRRPVRGGGTLYSWPVRGDWVIPVYLCAPPGTYTMQDLDDLTAFLNDEFDGYFRLLSSNRMTLRFTQGSVVTDDNLMADTVWETLDLLFWNKKYSRLRRIYPDAEFPCGDEATSLAGTSQILIVADVPHPEAAFAYARLRVGPAVVPPLAKYQDLTPFLRTVAHELAHSVLGLHHLKYTDQGFVFVNERDDSVGPGKELAELACYQYEQLDWRVPDVEPCVRLTPSRPLDFLSGLDGDGRDVVTWAPPRFTDDAPVTGYTIRYYRGNSASSDDEPYAEYDEPADARSHLIDESIEPGDYLILVAASSRYGQGDFRSVSFSYVPAPPPLGPISIAYISYETIQLSWSSADQKQFQDETGIQVTHQIQYKTDNDASYEELTGHFDTGIWLGDLDPGTEYTIRVRPCSSFSSKCAGWGTITASTFEDSVLSSPESVSVSSGSDWFLLTWDVVAGAESYVVDVPSLGGRYRRYTPDHAAVDGIQPSTTYTVRVGSCRPSTLFCEPEEWAEATFSTSSQGSVPPPYRIGVREIGDSWVTVLWDSLRGGPWRYRVEYEYSDGTTNSGILKHRVLTEEPLQLAVEPNRAYTLKLRNCELPESNPSCSTWTSFTFSTHPAVSAVAPPSIRATYIADTWLSVSWERVPGAISYDWRYKSSAGRSWIWGNEAELRPEGAVPTLETHSRLEPGTRYTVEVRSCGEPIRPCSDWTTTTVSTVASLPQAPPSYPLSVKEATDTEIHLAWNPASPQGHYYTVRMFSVEGQLRTDVARLTEFVEDHVISGLEPDTTYLIAARVCRWAGQDLCDDWVAINVSTRPSS